MSVIKPSDLTGVYRRYLASIAVFHQRVAGELDMGVADYLAISLLALERSMTAGELGAALGLTSGATTRLVDRLVRSGYAQRVDDPSDRRKVKVEYTGLIDERLGAHLASVREPIGEAIASLDAHQLQGLSVYLTAASAAFAQRPRVADGSTGGVRDA